MTIIALIAGIIIGTGLGLWLRGFTKSTTDVCIPEEGGVWTRCGRCKQLLPKDWGKDK